MKKITGRILICVLLSFALLSFGACGGENEQPPQPEGLPAPEESGGEGTLDSSSARVEPDEEIPLDPEPETSAEIRVYENGGASIKLFPDGTFIANLFHNTKITGTYTEMTDGTEIAVIFSYNGITEFSGGEASFKTGSPESEVGGILNDVLTIPLAWDDGHNHGMEFAYREYPVVFTGENSQKITLYADSTFIADFNNDVKIIGFYAIRATSVAFIPGSITANRSGEIVGAILNAPLIEDEEGGLSTSLELPEIWREAAGAELFVLQG